MRTNEEWADLFDAMADDQLRKRGITLLLLIVSVVLNVILWSLLFG